MQRLPLWLRAVLKSTFFIDQKAVNLWITNGYDIQEKKLDHHTQTFARNSTLSNRRRCTVLNFHPKSYTITSEKKNIENQIKVRRLWIFFLYVFDFVWCFCGLFQKESHSSLICLYLELLLICGALWHLWNNYFYYIPHFFIYLSVRTWSDITFIFSCRRSFNDRTENKVWPCLFNAYTISTAIFDLRLAYSLYVMTSRIAFSTNTFKTDEN